MIVLNCGYGKGLSVLQVLDAVDRANGAPLKRELGPRRAGDPPQLVAASEQIRRVLGWEPRKPEIETMIADAWAWHKANPDGYVRSESAASD